MNVNVGWLMELFAESTRNLIRHKLRSVLTLLGIVFGVASVITMLAVGEGAQQSVLGEIAGLGLRNIIIDSAKPPDTDSEGASGGGALRYGLIQRDFDQLRGALPEIGLSRSLWVKQNAYHAGHRINTRVAGTSPEYFDFFTHTILRGRRLHALDERNHRRVAVISSEVTSEIPAYLNPVGQTLKIGRHHFEVIGVAEMPALKGEGMVFIPFDTARTVFGTTTVKYKAGGAEYTQTDIGRIVLYAPREAIVPGIAEVVERTLTRNHSRPDYKLTVPLDILRSKQRTQQVFNLVLIVIAAISLVVGGIGIMNIMLAIVMERIREIGVRRALGAQKSDIFLQFLSESLVLSTVGGITGCLIGIALVPIAGHWTGWPGVITFQAIAVSLIVSWAVGLVFGTAPALRAAKLNPVDALRHD